MVQNIDHGEKKVTTIQNSDQIKIVTMVQNRDHGSNW